MHMQLTRCQCKPRQFGPRIRNWSTFNEPGVFAFSGYVFGSFPPGKFLATQLAGLVVKHMLIAHDKAYHLIKSLPGAFLDEHLLLPAQRTAGSLICAQCAQHLDASLQLGTAMFEYVRSYTRC